MLTGGRFYVRLGGVPLNEARAEVWLLKDELEKEYTVDALRFSTDQRIPNEMLVKESV